MKRLIDNLNRSVKHLATLDKVFRHNYPLYAETSKKLKSLPLYDELCKEIYAGGKKTRGNKLKRYGRQMILGDVLQYIITGRGYYFAVKDLERREAFISIIMYVCNLLLLMEDVSVDVKLRNTMLDTLESVIGQTFFEDNSQRIQFERLRDYGGRILPGRPGEGREYENCLDSLLPKRVGAVPELLVYAHFIRNSYGYMLSLLHSQRILGNRSHIVPPDFLLLRSKGEILGIEVGAGKERQMSSFSIVTSIPVFSVTVGDINQPQPFRCGRCYKWILYCDEAIRLCSKNEEPDERYIDCSECSLYQDIDDAKNNCPYIVYHGEAYHKTGRYKGEMKELRYHYNCVRKEPEVKKILKEADTPILIAPVPWISGLGGLKEDLVTEEAIEEEVVEEVSPKEGTEE